MDTQSTQQTQMYNTAFVSESALQMRLGTDELLNDLSNHLRGYEVAYFKDDKGKIQTKKDKIGESLVNEIGHQALIAKAKSIINSAIAQGNLTDDRYSLKISMMRQDLAYNLVNNQEVWEVKDRSLAVISSLITDALQLFLTRPINNEERRSYNNTMNINETTNQNNQQR